MPLDDICTRRQPIYKHPPQRLYSINTGKSRLDVDVHVSIIRQYPAARRQLILVLEAASVQNPIDVCQKVCKRIAEEQVVVGWCCHHGLQLALIDATGDTKSHPGDASILKAADFAGELVHFSGSVTVGDDNDEVVDIGPVSIVLVEHLFPGNPQSSCRVGVPSTIVPSVDVVPVLALGGVAVVQEEPHYRIVTEGNRSQTYFADV